MDGSTAGHRISVSVGEILGAIMLLPPLVYGAGYFMWIAPSIHLYGQNIASRVEVRGLIEPGIFYVFILACSLAFAVVVGLPRFQPPIIQFSRASRLAIELSVLFTIVVGYSYLGERLSLGSGAPLVADPAGSQTFMFAHVVILGMMWRRAIGLVRGRIAAPFPERRKLGPYTRLLKGALMVTLLVVQIPMAIVFGALGPNPAKRTRPITVVRASGAGNGAVEDRELLFVSKNADYLLAYDGSTKNIVEIPKGQIREVRWHRDP
jgi:hypothetical protein